MKTITISAKYIGKQIVLSDTYSIPENSDLLVTVLPPPETEDSEESFRRDWLALSAAGLARAYGDDEPEYPDSLIKEPNPEYGKR